MSDLEYCLVVDDRARELAERLSRVNFVGEIIGAMSEAIRDGENTISLKGHSFGLYTPGNPVEICPERQLLEDWAAAEGFHLNGIEQGGPQDPRTQITAIAA